MRRYYFLNLRYAVRILLPVLFTFNVSAATYTVTDGSDINDNVAPYSLRDAIALANASAGADVIQFNILPAGLKSIQLTGGDLIINEGVLIDGTTQPGYNSASPSPVIEIWGSGGNGFFIGTTAPNTTIKAICINRCSQSGVYVNASNLTLSGCFIGLDPTGTIIRANSQMGINFAAGANNAIIGGSTAQERNIISGNGQHGIQFAQQSGFVVTGNYIGTGINGNTDLGNGQNGITVYQSSNGTIGGSTFALRNIISGNDLSGVEVQTGTTVNIYGNYLGIGADGSTALGNSQHGVLIFINSNTVQVGGNVSGQGNVISSNGQLGVNCINSSNVSIRQNYIGVDATGLIARGNGNHGVQIQTCSGVVIGGDRTTEGNIISNSAIHGINYDPGSDGGIIQGNLIGTNKNGTAAFGNTYINVVVKSNNMTIGGNTANLGNVIVDAKDGAIGTGLLLANANNAIVRNNLIGVGLDGVTTLGNKTAGINISVEDAGQTASNNIIEYNTIAYNAGHGVTIGDALPVSGFGVGGYTGCDAEDGNKVLRNSIYCNTLKGINLNLGSCDDGNNSKLTPTLNSGTATNTFLQGTAAPNDSVHVYASGDCPSCSQGKEFIGKTKADGAGNWSFTSGTPFYGQASVTATDASNNTSEFAACITLPVSFISIAINREGNSNIVQWNTAWEVNNKFYEIERSSDGIHFEILGTVEGVGTSSSLSSYSFIDKDIYTPSYYRIRQVDYDGKSDYSKILFVSVQSTEGNAYLTYPAKELAIETGKAAGELHLWIYNVAGQLILTEEIICGESTVLIPLAGLSAGIYMLQYELNSQMNHQKILIP